MGGDSALNYDDTSFFEATDPKVFQTGSMLIGWTGKLRVFQRIQYGLQVPEHPKGREDIAYLVLDFTEALRNCLRSGGCLRKENEIEDAEQFLLGYRGTLYIVDSNFQVQHHQRNYYAIGSGGSYAMGVLYATEKGFDPVSRIQIALEAATEFCPSVRPKFTTLVL